MTSPDDRSTLTIKFGKGYEDPWFVASGNPASIRRQLLEFAGLEDDPDKTLQRLGIEVASDRRTYEEGYVDGSADGTRVDFELGYDKGFEEGCSMAATLADIEEFDQVLEGAKAARLAYWDAIGESRHSEPGPTSLGGWVAALRAAAEVKLA